MKKILLLFTLLVSFSFQNFAQTVPQEQRSLITKVTATWCPNCGTYGWEMFEGLIEDNSDKAVLIATHYSGDLVNPTADAVADNFNPPYQPRFYVGNEVQGVTSSNVAEKRIEIKNLVDANFLEAPIANAGMDAFITGDQLEVNTKTKFFQAADGEYYLGVYIIEDSVVHNQAGNSTMAVHKKIMRASVNGEHFGELLMNGSIAADTEFDHTFTMTLNTAWDTANLEIITIIWKKGTDAFQFVNTNMTNQFGEIVATKDLKIQGASMKVHPNIVDSESVVLIDLENNLRNASLSLFDQSGKRVKEVFRGDLEKNNNTFTISRNEVTAIGIYFLVLEANQKVITQKVIFK